MAELDPKVAIIQRYCPDLRIQTARFHHTVGQYSQVLIVNEDWIFRFPRYPEIGESFILEIQALEKIQPYLSLPIPNPVYQNIGLDRAEEIFMGYEMIHGAPLWTSTLEQITDRSIRKHLARQLAKFLQELHHIPHETLGLDFPLADQHETFVQMYKDTQNLLFPAMYPEARDRIAAHFEPVLSDLKFLEFTPCLRHGDFGPSNILYDPEQNTISGIIDFGFLAIGDPAVDLASAACLGDAFFQELCEYYPVTDEMLSRARFYQGTFALQEALAGLKYGDPQAYSDGLAEYAPPAGSQFTIRGVKLADAAALANLIRSIGWFKVIETESEAETQQRVYHHIELCLADKSHSIYVAENILHQIVGYTSVHWLPYLILAGPEGYVSELFIIENQRGKGIGRRLLNEVAKEANQRGCARLSLLNNRKRDSYRREFYKKAGWEERPDLINFVLNLPQVDPPNS